MKTIHFAPLQGYTDAVYREAHTSVFGGIEAYYTPFVRLEKGTLRNKELRELAPESNPSGNVIPQLIAATPDEFRTIAGLFREKGYRRADINLGCSFPMQVRARKGAGLLPYPEEAEALLRAAEEFPELAFSVKMRLGWENAEECMALVPVLNELPLEHITLHPRLGVQQYKGMVDRDGFARFYEACKHPLLYNGDLLSLEDIRAVIERFPRLRGVMLGRGLLAAPWLAAEYAAGEAWTAEKRREGLTAFHEQLTDRYRSRLEGGEHQVVAKLKTLWDYLLPDADKKCRKKIAKSTSLTAYRSAVKELLSL